MYKILISKIKNTNFKNLKNLKLIKNILNIKLRNKFSN